jgi:hypothetical protein
MLGETASAIFFTTNPTRTLLELNPVLQSKKPATSQGYMPCVTLILFQNSTAIITKSHEMFFVLFAIDVGKMSIRNKIKC